MKSKILKSILAGLVVSGAIGCKDGASNLSHLKTEDVNSSLAGLAVSDVKVREPGNHATSYVVNVGKITNDLDSGFLLSMVGKDYASVNIEKIFNLETNGIVIRQSGNPQLVPPSSRWTKRFTSESPEFCAELGGIHSTLRAVVAGSIYAAAEPRLSPVTDHLKKVFDSKCKPSLTGLAVSDVKVREPGNHATSYVVNVGKITNDLDSGFLLSMVGRNYASINIEKIFNLETNGIVIRQSGNPQLVPRSSQWTKRFTSESPEFCAELGGIHSTLRAVVAGSIYAAAEPRLSPVADHLKKLYDSKCK